MSSAGSTRRRRPPVGRLLGGSAVVAGLLALIGPFGWMLSISVGRPQDAYAQPYRWFRLPLRLHNYPDSLLAAPFGRYYANSLIISVTTTALVLATSLLTGYGLAKYRFRGRQAIFVLVVATMMVPVETTLIPLYLLTRSLGWLNSYEGLVIPFAVQGFGIFLMRQFIFSIPDHVLDAARIDGASEPRILLDMILPMTKPALAALAVFTFLDSWNQFLWPLLISNTPAYWTVQVGIADFYQRSSARPDLLMASSTIAMVPTVVLFIAMRRQFTATLPGRRFSR